MACVQQKDNRKTGAIGCCRHDRVVDRQGVVLGPNRPRENKATPAMNIQEYTTFTESLRQYAQSLKTRCKLKPKPVKAILLGRSEVKLMISAAFSFPKSWLPTRVNFTHRDLYVLLAVEKRFRQTGIPTVHR
jgi:hypothetical protein